MTDKLPTDEDLFGNPDEVTEADRDRLTDDEPDEDETGDEEEK